MSIAVTSVVDGESNAFTLPCVEKTVDTGSGAYSVDIGMDLQVCSLTAISDTVELPSVRATVSVPIDTTSYTVIGLIDSNGEAVLDSSGEQVMVKTRV